MLNIKNTFLFKNNTRNKNIFIKRKTKPTKLHIVTHVYNLIRKYLHQKLYHLWTVFL